MFEYREELCQGLKAQGLNPSEQQLDQLCKFADLLRKWNKVYNLTAIRRDKDILTHHLLDSASLVPLVGQIHETAGRVLDVGSGGGLPSIPLAILRPDLEVTAVDAVSKKTAFLTQVGIELGLTNFSARHARVECLQGRFDLVTSRAFASLQDFVVLTRSLIDEKGFWLAMKGGIPHEEIQALPEDVAVTQVLPMNVPNLEEKRHLIVLAVRSQC